MIASSIQLLEEKSLNAWASPRSLVLDGWILRFANGHTKRANSVNVLSGGSRSIAEKVNLCETIYAQQSLPPIFRMTPLAPAELDSHLVSLRYKQIDRSSVQIKDLTNWSSEVIDPALRLQIEVDASHWLERYAQLGEVSDPPALAAILNSIVPIKALAILYDRDRPVAGGLAVLEETHVGLFEVITSQCDRRRGYAQQLILRLLQWAKQQGAVTAYLQVALNHLPALRLYEKLGFVEHYRYFYRVRE